MAKKKTTKVPAGIILRKSAKGISVHIHAENGRKLTAMQGYNNIANAKKGLKALYDTLCNFCFSEWDPSKGVYKRGFVVTDLTKKKS